MTAETDKIRSFTLNGQTVEARPGETVVTVAERVGVDIPTLCHHRALIPYSACRVCMVEVKWGKRSKLVAACVYEPYEGDQIETDNERVRLIRSRVLELLLARCPSVRQIQTLAKQYDVRKDVYRTGEFDDARERCILCGRCVRVCNEIIGKHVIAYAKRGVRRRVTSPFESPSPDCIGCGACVFVCPTGALHSRDKGAERTMEELNTTLPMEACASCGRPFATRRQLEYVSERVKTQSARGNLCPDCRRQTEGLAWEQSTESIHSHQH